MSKVYGDSLHLAVAVFGYLLGYENAQQTLDDKLVSKFTQKMFDTELERIDLGNTAQTERNAKFHSIQHLREQSPRINDMLVNISKRVATLGVVADFFNQQLNLRPQDLDCIPFLYASWLRYLIGYNDQWEAVQTPTDTVSNEVQPIIIQTALGRSVDDLKVIDEILSNDGIWGTNLKQVKLQTRVFLFYARSMRYKGAVRDLLEDVV